MYLSNLYAEKIFSEHPIALWSLDEEVELLYADNQQNAETITGISIGTIDSGYRANMYGSSDYNGWYLGDGTSCYADNAGVPMVYGASNVTGLYPFAGQTSQSATISPSLIFPAFGFLNTSGKFKDLTLEAWVRITANAINKPFRIIGPIGSTDGIYVDGSYISIKINNFIGSHFIDDWQRPMLINFSISKNGASLLINGERVISLNFDIAKLSFPNKIENSLDVDWIGFYLAGDSVPLMDVDCIALYPFIVSETIAKKRFAYGQAVQYPQNLLSSYGGSSAVIDYSFSNYAKNYNYPQIGKWSNGVLNNLVAKSDILTVPDYQLPKIVAIKNGISIDTATFAKDLTSTQDPASPGCIEFIPTQDYSAGYIKFESLDILTEVPKAIFGVFNFNGSLSDESNQTLLKIQNNYNNDYIELEAEKVDSLSAKVNLIFNHGSSATTVEYFNSISIADEDFLVGIDIDIIEEILNSEGISDFFANFNNLSLYVGGSENGNKQYLGKIYRVGILNENSYNKVSSLIATHSDNGSLFDPDTTLVEIIGSYTMFPKWFADTLVFDIAIDASWQDYIPLSYLQKKIDDGTYAIDFLQFNIAHFSNTIFDTETKTVATAGNTFKAYASFQPSDSYIYQDFATMESLPTNHVIKPEGTTWNNTKYEVIDNVVIYPPQDTTLGQLSLVIKLEFAINGIKTNPMAIKSLQIASVGLNKESDTLIGTRLGSNFKIYNNSAGDNPFRIYKESSPYLYMNDKSGIQLVGDVSSDMNRGLALIVNPSKSPNFKLSTINMFIKYNKYEFSETPEPFFEIKNKQPGVEHLKFYTVASNQGLTRGIIKCYVVNGNTETEIDPAVIDFSVDGHPQTGDPKIELNEWHILSISFPKLLDFSDSDSYTVNFTGPMLVNNISYFRVGDTLVEQKTQKVDWSVIKEDPTPRTWDYWTGQLWSDVLYESFDAVQGIDQDTIYNIYLGTNRIVVDTDRNQDTLKFAKSSYLVYDKVDWQSLTIKPV
jgi:hypothetical protein